MVTKNDYATREVDACRSVLLELMTILGEFRDNIVLIGGNVPAYIIKSEKEEHIGSLDIDIAFNFMKIEADAYDTILKLLKGRGYYQEPGKQPFIFFRDVTDKNGDKIKVEINLLSGQYGGTGKSRRHQQVQDVLARKSRGCDLVFENSIDVKISGKMPDGANNEINIKIASIGPFLVMKGMALWDRYKEKDAYDIYYCCKYYPGGMMELEKDIRPVINNTLAKEGFGKIRSKFMDVNSAGPVWVANFLEISDTEEIERVKREAFELVDYIMGKLGIQSFEE